MERKAAGKVGRPPAIESVVVVLTGPKRKMPEVGEYRTSPKGKPFSGVRFRIERIYQRTIAEVASMGSALWMIFAPLAADADPEKLGAILAKLRAETSEDAFTELGVAMAVVADADQRARGYREVILSLLPRELKMRSGFYREVLEEGRQQGRVEGRVEGLMPLLFQFERRLNRKLSERERVTLLERFDALGAKRLGDVVLDLSTDELASWLATSDAA
jgi:hypothetical protein